MSTADETKVSRRPRYFLWILAAIGACSLIAAIFFVGFISGSIAFFSGSSAGSVTSDKHLYVNVQGQERFIAGVRLYGQITESSSEQVVDMLTEASEDKRVVGVLLDVNGPGGSVVASQEIFDKIAKLRETMPVVAYVREMAASGSYYSCVSSSQIIANRGSLIGSIGVIMQAMETSQLLNWLKLRPVTLKTGALKDSGSPTREWTDADKKYLQTLINATKEQFIGDVVSMRKLTPSTIALMGDGRVVLGSEAVGLGLIDSLGSKEDALNAVRKLANVSSKAELHYLEKQKSYADALFTFIGDEGAKSGLKNLLAKEIIGELKNASPITAQ